MTFSVTIAPANNSGTSVTINGWTAGRSMIGGLWFYDATVTASSIAMTSESAPSLIGTISRGGAGASDSAVQMFYLGSIASSGNKTITATLSGTPSTAGGIWAMEVDGGNTASLLDSSNKGNGNSGIGTGEFSINVTATNANAMVASFAESTSGDGAPVTSGYTTIALPNLGIFTYGAYDVDVDASGTKTLTYGEPGGNAPYNVVIASFNVATAPAGDIASLDGVTYSGVSAVDGVAVASIASINGVAAQ